MRILKDEFTKLGYVMSYTLLHDSIYHFDAIKDLYVQEFEIDITTGEVWFHTSNKVDEVSIDFNLLSLINKQIRLLIGDEHYG
nr:MAG TPA: hypothetical protein [Caudoviricetes sp.]